MVPCSPTGVISPHLCDLGVTWKDEKHRERDFTSLSSCSVGARWFPLGGGSIGPSPPVASGRSHGNFFTASPAPKRWAVLEAGFSEPTPQNLRVGRCSALLTSLKARLLPPSETLMDVKAQGPPAILGLEVPGALSGGFLVEPRSERPTCRPLSA